MRRVYKPRTRARIAQKGAKAHKKGAEHKPHPFVVTLAEILGKYYNFARFSQTACHPISISLRYAGGI